MVPIDHIVARQKRKALSYSAIAAAAVLVLVGFILRLVVVPEPKPALSFRESEDSILTVTHLSTNEEEPTPSTLVAGSRLVLRKGLPN